VKRPAVEREAARGRVADVAESVLHRKVHRAHHLAVDLHRRVHLASDPAVRTECKMARAGDQVALREYGQVLCTAHGRRAVGRVPECGISLVAGGPVAADTVGEFAWPTAAPIQ
jgi:hypothetical protein